MIRRVAAMWVLAAGLALPAPALTAPPTPQGDWSCAPCHSTAAWSAIPERVAFDHGRTGTPLTGAHASAPCSGCHRPSERTTAAVPRACTGCHTDEHRGSLGSRCQDCHSATTWLAPRSLVSHEATRFPLTGAHTAVECRSCHTRLGGEVWRGTPTICGDCHGNLAQQVRKPDHRLVGFGPGCQTCHATFTWSPARVNHSVWWPLEGRHAAADCASCHGTGVWRGASEACLSCHADKLAGAHPDHKALGLPTTCSDCHTAIAWNVLKKTWHEGLFPISSGRHAGISCSGCHAGGLLPAQLSCTGCHEHAQARMADEHDDVGGYVWQSQSCYGCHPSGKAD